MPRQHSSARMSLLLSTLLLITFVIGQPLPHSQAAPSQAEQASTLQQAGCPAAPTDLDDIIERPEFCVYYDSDNVTAAQAIVAADQVQAYWDRYTDDFGFNEPAYTGKLEVQLTNDANCNGRTWQSRNVMTTHRGCFGISELMVQLVLGHELFHRVQYNHDTDRSNGGWFREGTARAMEDMAFDEIDNWDEAASTAPFSFNQQANRYLTSTNEDITSEPMRYNSALWWKYFSEQYGTTATEPELGVDAFLELWQAAETTDNIAAINQTLNGLGAGTNFDTAFRRFTVANWTKDLTGVPDGSYNYIDEDQAGNPAQYGPLLPANGDTISIGSPATFLNQDIERYGAAYYEATPGSDCPVVSASFQSSASDPAFYHVVTQKGSAFATHVEGSGANWTQSFLNDGITKIVAIAGSLGNASNDVDITLSCDDPVIDIRLPNNDAEAYAGPAGTPGKFLAQVLVTNGSPTAPVVAGLSISDFNAEVNGVPAFVTAGGFIQEQYWLVIEAPVQGSNGTYDLEITLEEPGTTTPIAVDSNADSVTYTADNLDHALVIDRSGSMGEGNKMSAAQDAANFYVDITRNDDGLAVVPYNGNVTPNPFDMESVNLNVRNDAKAYINELGPSGTTSIGDGMQEAADQRNNTSTGNPRCSFVLLSDGMENSEAFWSSVEADVVATGCPVTSIAFGPASNETLMQDIATATGGLFFYNDVFVSSLNDASLAQASATPTDSALDLGNVYEYAQAQSEGRERLRIVKDTVALGDTDEQTVVVDESMSEVLFALDWVGQSGITGSLQLRDPDGNIISSNTQPYDFNDQRSGHVGWRIPNPTPGQWTMLVQFSFVEPQAQLSQQSGINYQVVASGPSSLSIELLLPDRLDEQFFTGNTVPIYAFVSDSQPLPNLPVEAVVTAPDGTTTIVPLLDDGQNGDGASGDGMYAGLYTRVNQANTVAPTEEEGDNPQPQDEGAYRVQVRVSSGAFQREALGSFAVLEGADSNGNGLPDPFEEETGVSDPNGDPDLDSLDTLSEYFSGTDPLNSDTDGGGENDGSEVLLHGQDPLNPDDDEIEAPEFLHAIPENGAVQLSYDVKAEYEQILLYRATSQQGPWILRSAELPLTGVYSDSATNEQTYYYRLIAIDDENHRSAVLESTEVTPRVDPIPPEGIVLINDGAARTASLDVQLSFTAYQGEGIENFSDIKDILISNDPSFAGATWRPFAQNISWQLAPTAPGATARVYVRYRDTANNESVGTEVDTIIYDPGGLGGSTRVYLPLIQQ
ncbi:MAG: VWA domain-containing protein [Chloroflexota bacterium]